MNLIEVWEKTPSSGEMVLLSEHGDEMVTVIKRGSFLHILRQVMEYVPEKDALSDRWRWRP